MIGHVIEVHVTFFPVRFTGYYGTALKLTITITRLVFLLNFWQCTDPHSKRLISPTAPTGYSRLSLSRPRLPRITTYLEVKIWSLFLQGNLTTGIKILWKRGVIAPQEQFLLFSTIFSIYILTSGVKLHIHLLNVVVRFIVFVNSANLICRRTDISKYSRESLGLRDNESRLYFGLSTFGNTVILQWLEHRYCGWSELHQENIPI